MKNFLRIAVIGMVLASVYSCSQRTPQQQAAYDAAYQQQAQAQQVQQAANQGAMDAALDYQSYYNPTTRAYEYVAMINGAQMIFDAYAWNQLYRANDPSYFYSHYNDASYSRYRHPYSTTYLRGFTARPTQRIVSNRVSQQVPSNRIGQTVNSTITASPSGRIATGQTRVSDRGTNAINYTPPQTQTINRTTTITPTGRIATGVTRVSDRASSYTTPVRSIAPPAPRQSYTSPVRTMTTSRSASSSTTRSGKRY